MFPLVLCSIVLRVILPPPKVDAEGSSSKHRCATRWFCACFWPVVPGGGQRRTSLDGSNIFFCWIASCFLSRASTPTPMCSLAHNLFVHSVRFACSFVLNFVYTNNIAAQCTVFQWRGYIACGVVNFSTPIAETCPFLPPLVFETC